MKILANLGTLADGRTALVIEDAYKPDYVIVNGFDPATQSWNDGGEYFDGNLTSFAKAITDANLVIGYDRMKQIATNYINNDVQNAESWYVNQVLNDVCGLSDDEMRALDMEWLLDIREEQ